MSRRLPLALVFAVAAAVSVPAPAAPAQDVTIAVRQYVSPTSGGLTLAFSGRIGSAAAGESVFLLVRECGCDHYRVVDSTTTTAGGLWSIEIGRMLGAWRAHWNDRPSAALTIRAPIFVTVARVPGRRGGGS